MKTKILILIIKETNLHNAISRGKPFCEVVFEDILTLNKKETNLHNAKDEHDNDGESIDSLQFKSQVYIEVR